MKTCTLRASSVNGSNHGSGPTFDCQTKVYGLLIFNSFITRATVDPTSDGYASPLFTVLSGIECAENNIMTSFRFSSGNCKSSFLILSANVCTSNGCVAHRSITLQLMFRGSSLIYKNKNLRNIVFSFNLFVV